MTKAQARKFIERAYRAYPRKLGKSRGIARLERQLTSEGRCREFFEALQKFVAYHERRATEPQFIPYFSSFVSEWEDWLDADTGTCIEFKKNFDDLFKNIPASEEKKLEHREDDAGAVPSGNELSGELLRRTNKV